MPALNTLERIHHQLMSRFTWVADSERYQVREHWADHYDAFHAGQHIYDDCDGFAITAALIAKNDYEVSPAEIALQLCLTEVGLRKANPPAFDHIVCVIGPHVLDNRLRRVITRAQTGYLWERYMTLDNPGVWKK